MGFAGFSWIDVTNRGGGRSDDAQRIDQTYAAAIAVAPAIPARGCRCGARAGFAFAGLVDRLYVATGVAGAGLE